MIFYFSGTGNSLEVAKNIGINQDERLISIAKEMKDAKESYDFILKDEEKVVFVYPIYAWAPPKMVTNFIEKLNLINYKNNYISTVVTCEKNIGNTIKVLENALGANGLRLNSGFSVVMPTNYIILSKAETEEVSNKKLSDASKALEKINTFINDEKEIVEVEKGSMPLFRTSIINSLFLKYSLNTKKFYVTEDCIGCKVCEKICNSKCITVDKTPTWGDNCCQCLACINYCPKEAIQYGKGTINKKRYHNPNITFNDMDI